MFRKMLVPLDGSELMEQILPYVSLLARRLEIPVLLMTAIDPGALDVPDNSDNLFGPWEERVRDRLNELAELLKNEGVQAETIISRGRAQNQILEVGSSEGCDLIAMATKGRGLLGWAMLGSVTYNVIHSSPVPVLTIAPEKLQGLSVDQIKISRIPVPLDGSELAESALPYVEFLAEKLSSEIVLIRVIPDEGHYLPFLSQSATMELKKEVEENARLYLQNIAARLRREGFTVEWRLLEGSAGPQIMAVDQESAEDLLVMTTRGRSGIIPGVLGSVSISVLRNSANPVLVIPPHADSDANS